MDTELLKKIKLNENSFVNFYGKSLIENELNMLKTEVNNRYTSVYDSKSIYHNKYYDSQFYFNTLYFNKNVSKQILKDFGIDVVLFDFNDKNISKIIDYGTKDFHTKKMSVRPPLTPEMHLVNVIRGSIDISHKNEFEDTEATFLGKKIPYIKCSNCSYYSKILNNGTMIADIPMKEGFNLMCIVPHCLYKCEITELIEYYIIHDLQKEYGCFYVPKIYIETEYILNDFNTTHLDLRQYMHKPEITINPIAYCYNTFELNSKGVESKFVSFTGMRGFTGSLGSDGANVRIIDEPFVYILYKDQQIHYVGTFIGE